MVNRVFWAPLAVVAISALVLVPTEAQAPVEAQEAQTTETKPLAIENPDLFKKSLDVATQAVELFVETDDEAEQERVAEIGYRLVQAANFHEVPFTFHVVRMPEPNAFALPGGHIFVTTSMLSMGVTDDMLAGLLGHEVAHVVEHHGTRMQRRQTLLQVLGQALVVGVMVKAHDEASKRRTPSGPWYDPYRQQENPEASMVEGAAATSLIVSELLLRGYSREFEREADDEGQRFAAGAGFAPDGLKQLMDLMLVRLPQSRDYGYWQTHPFFDERVRGSEVRAALLVAQPPKSSDELRRATQEQLLTYRDATKLEPKTHALLERQALAAWPRGQKAEAIRLGRVHEAREELTQLTPLSRDYGALLTLYQRELATLARVSPGAQLEKKLAAEVAELETERDALLPQAQKVLVGEVFETAFLERFLSNFPQATEVPRAALALGDAMSRLGQQDKAVSMYQRAAAVREAPEAARARQGLVNLAPILDNLAALETLATGPDAELAELARPRLAKVVSTFEDIGNGAEYLQRFPSGAHREAVTARVNSLAEELYTEVVLYQGVGDNAKALDRIQKILTHAPASRAAALIRENAVIES